MMKSTKLPAPISAVQTVNAESRIRGLDGLRAVACLAVFGVHWQQATGVGGSLGPFDWQRLLLNGNTGVALFMVLSGFLLSLPVFAAGTEKLLKDPLPGFWRRRACRILPAYWLCLAILVVASLRFRTPGQWVDLALHATFLHNLIPQTVYSISSPFWAIAVFVQFYVLFYILVMGLRYCGWLTSRSLVIAFSAMALISLIASETLASVAPADGSSFAAGWMGTDAICLQHSLLIHVPVYWFGVLAAYLHSRVAKAAHWGHDILIALAAFALFVVLATDWDESLQSIGTRYNWPIIPLILAAVILAVPRSLVAARLLEWSPIQYLGVVSYAFYLFHLPVLSAIAKLADRLQIRWGMSPGGYGLVSAATTFLACLLLWLLFERPILLCRRAKMLADQ